MQDSRYKTRRHKEEIRRRLTQIDADLFLAGFGVPSKAGSATLARAVLKVSFCDCDLPSATGHFVMPHL